MIDKVLIDSVPYRIDETDDPILLDGIQCGGKVDYNLGVIQLGKEYSVRGLTILMHEIVHALMFERGIANEHNTEEVVDALAKGIVNLIRDNKSLIEAIQNNQA